MGGGDWLGGGDTTSGSDPLLCFVFAHSTTHVASRSAKRIIRPPVRLIFFPMDGRNGQTKQTLHQVDDVFTRQGMCVAGEGLLLAGSPAGRLPLLLLLFLLPTGAF